LAYISPFPVNDSLILVADAGVVKQIVNDRVLFSKPLERYKTIEVYGKVNLPILIHKHFVHLLSHRT
jgi:hypothetical protein